MFWSRCHPLFILLLTHLSTGVYKTYSYQRTITHYLLLISSLTVNLLKGIQQRWSLCAVTKSENLVGCWETSPFASHPALSLLPKKNHRTRWVHSIFWGSTLSFHSPPHYSFEQCFKGKIEPRILLYFYNILKNVYFQKWVNVYISHKNSLFSIFVVWRGFEPTVKLLQFLSLRRVASSYYNHFIYCWSIYEDYFITLTARRPDHIKKSYLLSDYFINHMKSKPIIDNKTQF